MDLATDFTAYAAAMVAFTRQATGLAQNRVLLLRPNTPSAQRPQRPFAAIGLRSIGQPVGRDWQKPSASVPNEMHYIGTRTMQADFDFYADTAMQAADLASTLMAATRVPVLTRQLFDAGLSIWARDGVQDLSALVNTAYEGRAQASLQFAYSSCLTYTVDTMLQVTVTGTASGQGVSETVTLTANLPKGST